MKQKIHNIYKHSFFRYLVIGTSTFAIDFSILILLHGFLKVNVLIAASISYWLSIAYNFLLNRYWTFGIKNQDNIYKHAAMYGVLLLFNYLFTIGFLAVTVHYFQLNYILAKLAAVAFQVSWTYFIYKKVIFKSE